MRSFDLNFLIKRLSNYSIFFNNKVKLINYINNKTNSSNNTNNNNDKQLIEIKELIISPEKLLTNTQFENYIITKELRENDQLLQPISNRIKKFKQLLSNSNSLDDEIKDIINNIIIGYEGFIKLLIEVVKNGSGLEDGMAIGSYNGDINEILKSKQIIISEQDLEYREITIDKAYELISYDQVEYEFIRKNSSGISIGSVVDDVYFKVNRNGLLDPAKENAVFEFYSGIFGTGQRLISPTQLLLILELPLLEQNLSDSPERKELIDLKKRLNVDSAKKVFKMYPDLKNRINNSMYIERVVSIQGNLYQNGETFDRLLKRIQEKLQEEQQEEYSSSDFKDRYYNEIESSIDSYSYSSHIISSLLLNQSDYKPDNLIVNQDSKLIIGIDNDDVLQYNEFLNFNSKLFIKFKNILFTLSNLMIKPINIKCKEEFIKINPYEFTLVWLSKIYEKDNIYNQLIEKSLPFNFEKRDRSIDNIKQSLNLPLKFSIGWIDSMLSRFIKIKQFLVERQNDITHQELFKEIYPLAAYYYETLSNELPLNQIRLLYNDNNHIESYLSLLENPQIVESFNESISINQQFKLSKETVSVRESLFQFISNLDLNNLIKISSNSFLNCIKIIISFQQQEEDKESLEFNSSYYSLIQKSILLIIDQEDIDLIENTISNYLKSIKILQQPQQQLLDLDEFSKPKSIVQLIISSSNIQNQDKVLESIRVLKEFGANLDMIENGWSALDNLSVSILSLDYKIKLFKGLVALGSGKTSSFNRIGKFYRSLGVKEKNELSESIEKLTNINQRIGWNLSLNHLFPLLSSNLTSTNKQQQQLNSKILYLTNGDKREVSNTFWEILFDENNLPRKSNSYGTRCVPFVEDNVHRIYLKFDPQFPGNEISVSTLAFLLFGYNCCPFTELGIINGYPVLLSQGIKGETLFDISKGGDDQIKLSLLDSSSVSKLIILEMLINNADGNLSNYLIKSIYDSISGGIIHKIYSIDNDQAFMPSVSFPIKNGLFSKKNSLQVESSIFLLDQMNEQVHKDVIDCFKDKNLIEILRKWLENLKALNDQWIKFFTNISNIDTNKLRKEKKSIIGISFLPDQMNKLFSKILRLQILLNKPMSHFQILEILEPSIALRYKNVLNSSNLRSLYEKYKYFKQIQDNEKLMVSSIYTSIQVLESLNIPSSDYIQETIWSGEYSPQKALNELLEIEKQHLSIKEVFGRLKNQSLNDNFGNNQNNYNNNLSDNNSFSDDIGKITESSLFEDTLKHSDFENLSPMQEQILLKTISTKQLQILYLNKSRLISSHLNSFNFSRLILLKLSECLNIKKICNSLGHSLHLPVLEKLKLNNCPNLKVIKIKAINLKSFSACQKCSSIKTFEIETPNLEFIKVTFNNPDEILQLVDDKILKKINHKTNGIDSAIGIVGSLGSSYLDLIKMTGKISKDYIKTAISKYTINICGPPLETALKLFGDVNIRRYFVSKDWVNDSYQHFTVKMDCISFPYLNFYNQLKDYIIIFDPTDTVSVPLEHYREYLTLSGGLIKKALFIGLSNKNEEEANLEKINIVQSWDQNNIQVLTFFSINQENESQIRNQIFDYYLKLYNKNIVK